MVRKSGTRAIDRQCARAIVCGQRNGTERHTCRNPVDDRRSTDPPVARSGDRKVIDPVAVEIAKWSERATIVGSRKSCSREHDIIRIALVQKRWPWVAPLENV